MIYRYILDLIDDGLIRKGKALDLGCGPGTASTLLSSLGFQVEAVDIKEYHVPGANSGGIVTFIQSNVRDFPIQEGIYDFIHARHILHFLNKDEIGTVIQRMYKGLKKGGVMYFTVSGDKDGWIDKSKNVTFLTDDELTTYVEGAIPKNGVIHNKIIRLGYGTTTNGVRKFSHTIAYTILK